MVNRRAGVTSRSVKVHVSLKVLPGLIREASKPLQAIDSIKIVQVDGLGAGGASAASHGAAANDGNLASAAVSAALRYRAQAPVIDGLMKELGFDGATLDGLANGATRDIVAD